MKTAAVVSADGIGDALIMQIGAHHLMQQGYLVTTFSNHLAGFGAWIPHKSAPQPKLEEIPALFSSFDLILLQHDNSLKAKEIKKLPHCFTFYGSHLEQKHGRLTPQDYVCNPEKSMVENLSCALENWFGNASKETGIKPPSQLIHRKYPKRIAIHPGASSDDKRWPLAKFVRLAALLKTQGFDPIFLTTNDIHLLSSLESLASFLYESGAFIGNDSGPGHLASLLNIPTLIIGQDPKHFDLWQPGWYPPVIATPSAWVSYCKFTRKRWKSFLSVNKVNLLFNKNIL